MKWSWKRWQTLVSEHVTDADALKLAEVWPGYVKGKHYRSFWAHEIQYSDTPLAQWGMSRVMKAANVLEAVGLSSRCPGTPLYAPTFPKDEFKDEFMEAFTFVSKMSLDDLYNERLGLEYWSEVLQDTQPEQTQKRIDELSQEIEKREEVPEYIL